jgi:hypothetical protein
MVIYFGILTLTKIFNGCRLYQYGTVVATHKNANGYWFHWEGSHGVEKSLYCGIKFNLWRFYNSRHYYCHPTGPNNAVGMTIRSFWKAQIYQAGELDIL